MRKESAELYGALQERITEALEEADGKARFESDIWLRDDKTVSDGGGGDTRILRNGALFEQAGVNFSKVHGTLPAEMSRKLGSGDEEVSFFACGVSLVIHPYSPMVPTTHANFRYLETGEDERRKAWFGGGMDLTPYHLIEEDARHFHTVIKEACDKHDPEYYPRFKKWCDEYFFIPHRQECRGVGGCFYDYLGRDSDPTDAAIFKSYFEFVKDISSAFLDAYLPIVERRKNLPFSPEEKTFQLIRRGRYVEFNLIYDRGTLFGLKTGGRVESILMSLPPQVKWEYNDKLIYSNSPKEQELLSVLRSPRDWI